jgi:hypothetical protein
MNLIHGFDSNNPSLNPDKIMFSNAHIKRLFIGYSGVIKNFLDRKRLGHDEGLLAHNLLAIATNDNLHLISNDYRELAMAYRNGDSFEKMNRLSKREKFDLSSYPS